jgi:hypothetical protein
VPLRLHERERRLDRHHAKLPGVGWTVQPATPAERAHVALLVANHSRSTDEVRQLLDALDLWPTSAEHAVPAAPRKRPTSTTRELAEQEDDARLVRALRLDEHRFAIFDAFAQ